MAMFNLFLTEYQFNLKSVTLIKAGKNITRQLWKRDAGIKFPKKADIFYYDNCFQKI